MPTVNWGLSVKAVESFDRDAQFAPYRGQIPPNAVYRWRVYKLQFFPGGTEKYPQLRIFVELLPRTKAEGKYRGFRVVSFRAVADHTPFNYVPFLDAIGVTAPDFVNRTKVDSEGNVLSIGRWRNNGKQEIDAQLVSEEDLKGAERKDIKWIGAVLDDEPDDSDDDDYLDDSDDDEEYADDAEYADESDDDSDYYDE